MSVVDWLWEQSVFIAAVGGSVSLWLLFRVLDHRRIKAETHQASESFIGPGIESWEHEEWSGPYPAEITLLAEYARSDSSGIKTAQKAETGEDFEGFRNTSPAQMILIDLVRIAGTLADDSEGPCWHQVDLLRAFGAASGDHRISIMHRTPTMNLLEGRRIEEPNSLVALWVLAVRDDPDRHRLRDMYIGFARLAGCCNIDRLSKVTEIIREASEPDLEEREEAIKEMESIRANLEEQLNERYRKVLGITAESTREEIKAAYHRQVVLWHPDRLVGMAPELQAAATERLKEINEAYECVCWGV